jgi:proteic killer suppression protein
VIQSFRHKGLQAFFETGSRKGIQAMHAERLREMLTALNVAAGPQDLTRLSWRLVFRFTADGVELVDYLDYH